MRKLIKARHVQGNPSHIKMLLNQQNPYAVGRLSNYFAYFNKATQQRLVDLRSKLSKHTSLEKEHSQLLKAQEVAQQEQEKNKRELQAVRENRSKSVNRLNEKVNTSNAKLEQLKKDRARLNSLIEQIAKQARKLKELERKRALEESRETKDKKPSTDRPVRRLVKGGFKKQKGRLQYPVNAQQKYAYGARVQESGMKAQGIFFDTSTPRPVRSIFRGRVLFSDYLKGYGLLLIIDHGDQHISLYGHNELVYKNVGDLVETNEVISQSGTSGGLQSAGVYFEIRKDATPVDPANWCR